MPQEVELPITEIKTAAQFTKVKYKHGPLLPNNIRALFCGPSNCGKTNALLNLIYSPNGLSFENIYLYSKSRYQPKYQELEAVLSHVPEIGYFPFDDNESVISPNEAKENSIFIFDDVACEKQNHLRAFFCMGRHRNIDSFYLLQTYTSCPKHLVRDNLNMLLIFKQDFMNLKHIYHDHVNTDMNFKEFCDMCCFCWNSKSHGCLLIDKT
ncbi:MAG: hypothetical protein H9Q65_06335, partial [Spiroplasma ixodetis]|nr:hypothetical protein [Spiroplasma ixodetis]